MRGIPIRWRLAAGFSAAMAVVLLALGIFVYARVNDALRRSVDQALRSQSVESSQHVTEGNLLDNDARASGTVVELLDAQGRVARSTPAGLAPFLEGAAFARARSSARSFARFGAGRESTTAGGCSASRHAAGVLVVARPLRATEETLHHLLRGLILAGPVGLALATLGGYLLAAAALRPVEAMRKRATAISAETPGARLPVPRSRDEIQQLAMTLNEMLGRLEAAFAHERRFVADASHELRTPLALLKAELDLALRRPANARRAAGGRHVRRGGDRPPGAARRGSAPDRPVGAEGAAAPTRAPRSGRRHGGEHRAVRRPRARLQDDSW